MKSFKDILNERSLRSINIGEKYKIKQYSAKKNQKITSEAEVVDFIKRPGSKSFVVYAEGSRQTKVSVDVFKSMLA